MPEKTPRKYVDAELLRERPRFQLAKIWGTFAMGTLGWLATLAGRGKPWTYYAFGITYSILAHLISVLSALRYGQKREGPPSTLLPPSL